MKKRNLFSLVFACLCLLAGAGVGMGIASFRDNAPMVVYAEGEETTEPTTSEETTTEEESSKWKELYETAIQKYEEIKNKQIAGTTIGALVGAVVGAIVSFVPAMLNRSNIRKSIDDLVIARGHVERLHSELEAIKTDFKIQKEEFDLVVKSVDGLEKNLIKMEKTLEKALEDNAILHKENAELKEMILDLFSHSEVLVALGVSEEALKKYLPNK